MILLVMIQVYPGSYQYSVDLGVGGLQYKLAYYASMIMAYGAHIVE
jgi:hypothetical protein